MKFLFIADFHSPLTFYHGVYSLKICLCKITPDKGPVAVLLGFN